MKKKLLFVLMSFFLIASCSKEDKLIPKPDPTPTPDSTATPDSIPTLPIAEGETHWMILTCTKAVNDTIKLAVKAAEADRKNVWIDLNANGKKDEGEAVTKFDKEKLAYVLGAQTIVVYGKVLELRCQESNLSALDVSSNAALKLLYCYDNQLASLDVSKNTELDEFRCHKNKLNSLDVSKNKELLYLWCASNALTELDISNNSKLKELWLSGNKITDVDKMQNIVDALPSLKGKFWVVETQTSKENTINKEQVKIATAKGWKVWDDNNKDYTGESANPTDTNKMILSTNKAAGETINLRIDAAKADRADVWIDLNNNGEKEEGEAVTKFWEQVSYSLGAQSIVVYGNVSKFDCFYSNLTSLDVSSNAALELLMCYNNQLSSLNVSKNPALIELRCNKNVLTKLDVSENTAMKKLECHENKLTQLDLSKNTALQNLECHRNNLTQLKLTSHQNLVSISIFNNKIKEAEMQHIVDALPHREAGNKGHLWVVVEIPDEENLITKKQVEELSTKNWRVTNARGINYEGQ